MQRWISSLCIAGAALLAGIAHAGPVNINTADAETLARELTGIGAALAAEIVRDREQNGPYESAESLVRVKGIGTRVIEMNRDFILTAQPAREADAGS
jgi:competence protein ComEA